MLAQMARLNVNAQTSKAPVQAMVDRVAAVFVPVICMFALVVFTIWLAVSYKVLPDSWLPPGENRFVFSLLFLVTVLVIACPCALGLATPTAVMVGTGLGAAHGILIKGGAALELLSKVTTIVFDKTGTLTRGTPEVTGLGVAPEAALTGWDAKHVILRAGSAEAGSEHPICRAIVERATCGLGVGDCLPTATNVRSVAGRGLVCDVDQKRMTVGNRTWMAENGIASDQLSSIEACLVCEEASGRTAVAVAVDGRLVGWISVADTLRPESRHVVSRLIEAGVDVWMLTGDNKVTADAIAASAGITQVLARVSRSLAS
jgi:P-type Cu+ transporter